MSSGQLARKEGRQMKRRSLTSTLPADSAPPSRLWLSDRPGWCVDLGEKLVAMRTADLWLALAKDEVAPGTKVWREGMPYWTEIENVPEFSLAMPDAAVWAPGDGPRRLGAPASGANVPASATSVLESIAGAQNEAAAAKHRIAAVSGAGSEASLPPRASVADVMSLVPPSDFTTPAPVVVEPRASEHAASGPRRIFPRLDRRNAMSVAIGAAVAIGALLFATTGPAPGRALDGSNGSQPASAAGRPRGPTIDFASNYRAIVTQPAALPLPPPDMEKAPSTETTTAATPERREHVRGARGPHAADRGQRRAR